MISHRSGTTHNEPEQLTGDAHGCLEVPSRYLIQNTLECTSQASTESAAPLFALLFVCRQIYTEVALLPFASNDFIFSSSSDLRAFVAHLTEQQTRALHAKIMTHSFLDAWEDARILSFEWRSHFRYLQSVVIISGSGTGLCCNHPRSRLKQCNFKFRKALDAKQKVRIILAGDVQAQQSDLTKQQAQMNARALNCACTAFFPFQVISLGYESRTTSTDESIEEGQAEMA